MTFEEYERSLAPVSAREAVGEVAGEADIRAAAKALEAIDKLDLATLAELVRKHPEWIPTLGLAVGISRERLQNVLKHWLGTSNWNRLAKERASELVATLDEEFDVVERLEAQRQGRYTFGDVLIARASSRRRAGAAIAGGRGVEDAIERAAGELRLPYDVRTRFVGRAGATAPCDLSVPRGATDAVIVCAAKGFDSTGSKLTDAVREIEAMAEARLPRQYVFAVVDGIGWNRRQGDLRRLYALFETQRIDGLYTLAMLDRFKKELDEAANRASIPRQRTGR